MSRKTSTRRNPSGSTARKEQIDLLLKKCDETLHSVSQELDDARTLAERAGLSIDSSCLDNSFRPPHLQQNPGNVVVLRTTGGHSNTDHMITFTGDPRTDRIAELKRALQRRVRAMQPENKGEDRWDKPKIFGERRRRIVREKDKPEAPPEPPPSGWVVFVEQQTTKIRHDRPNERHNQSKVIKEISKLWNHCMSEKDKAYYNDFAREARDEYQQQSREFRATGAFTPSAKFCRAEGVGPWIRAQWHEKNALEREISSYDTVQFPPRPPEFDEAYRKREEESKRKRREKEKGEQSTGKRRRKKKEAAQAEKKAAPKSG
jgi:hypothetical protein